MLFQKKNRSHERFYLFPGQGGRNYVRKQRVFLRWAVIVGVFFGAVVSAVIWWFSHPSH